MKLVMIILILFISDQSKLIVPIIIGGTGTSDVAFDFVDAGIGTDCIAAVVAAVVVVGRESHCHSSDWMAVFAAAAAAAAAESEHCCS